ncbi:MAG: hypothetical protein KKD18_06835 [Nanoarchaeota archaeon]|nr:hypothetical protein [Nanoarchaeota archaeon]MBU0978107.1 hypothetical protein [Nanoarchaeota archaeon]
MKKIILFFLLFIPLVSAIQFSPTSLEFNLGTNQVACKNVYFQVESSTTLRDAWAQSSSSPWTITNFQTSSQELGLELSYPSEVNSGQGEIQLCLSGSQAGDYKGALIFRQGETGSSIVQFAVWLKASIAPSNNLPQEESPSSSKTSKSSGSYHGSNTVLVPGINPTKPENTLQKINYNLSQEEIKLNKPSSIKGTSSSMVPILLITLLVILIILFLFVILIR